MTHPLAILILLLGLTAQAALQSPRAASNGTTVPMALPSTNTVPTNFPPRMVTLYLEVGGRIEAKDALDKSWLATTLPTRIPVTIPATNAQMFFRWALVKLPRLSWNAAPGTGYRLYLGPASHAYDRVIESAVPFVDMELPWRPTYASVTVVRADGSESDFCPEAKL